MERLTALAVRAVALAVLAGCGRSHEPAPAPQPATAQGAPESPAGVVLAPAFHPGDVVRYEYQETTIKTQSSPLHSIRRDAFEGRVIELTTLEAEPGGVATLRLRVLKAAAVLADNGAKAFEYDSEHRTDDHSAPARARDLLLGLDATVRVGPGGTVLSMRANITPEQLGTIPEGLRPLLAENWFRGVIEMAFRPVSGDRAVAAGTRWSQETDAGDVLAPAGGRLRAVFTVKSLTPAEAEFSVETGLDTPSADGPANRYTDTSAMIWDRAAGRLERLVQRQSVEVHRDIAGTPGVETIDREIVFRRLNPEGAIDDIDSSVR